MRFTHHFVQCTVPISQNSTLENSNIFKRRLMIYLTTWNTPSDHFKRSDHYENYDGSTHSEPFYFPDHSDHSDHCKHSDN